MRGTGTESLVVVMKSLEWRWSEGATSGGLVRIQLGSPGGDADEGTTICPLQAGTAGCQVCSPDGSGMSREVHVPFYERLGVQFPRPTHRFCLSFHDAEDLLAQRGVTVRVVLVVVLAMVGGNDHGAAQTLWRGLVVAPEVRCAPYDADAYRYPQSVEARIVAALGGVYGPYTGRWFASPRDTDIEHIVARSEAHDSGLCAADAASQRRFASDLLNLTLASPAVNRTHKNDKDAAEWLPDLNQCWFADRVVAVRRKFGLTIDPREAAALDRVLVGCRSTAMLVVPRPAASTQRPTPPPALSPPVSEALARWDDNGNGRITCAEARRHGIAPVRRGHPAYSYMRDADNDGIVCE